MTASRKDTSILPFPQRVGSARSHQAGAAIQDWGEAVPRGEWLVLEAVLPYAQLPDDWPVMIKAAAQAADRE